MIICGEMNLAVKRVIFSLPPYKGDLCIALTALVCRGNRGKCISFFLRHSPPRTAKFNYELKIKNYE